MWIDKRKINTLETFIRQSLSNPIENESDERIESGREFHVVGAAARKE